MATDQQLTLPDQLPASFMQLPTRAELNNLVRNYEELSSEQKIAIKDRQIAVKEIALLK